jgi:hypothetical protein
METDVIVEFAGRHVIQHSIKRELHPAGNLKLQPTGLIPIFHNLNNKQKPYAPKTKLKEKARGPKKSHFLAIVKHNQSKLLETLTKPKVKNPKIPTQTRHPKKDLIL